LLTTDNNKTGISKSNQDRAGINTTSSSNLMIKVPKEYHRYSSLNSWGGTKTEIQTSIHPVMVIKADGSRSGNNQYK
jgi:hypothetical protein